MKSTFHLTDDHIKLLRRMYVGYNDSEHGAPEIDPKRPYGNSWVEGDIHEILTEGNQMELTEELKDKYNKLHRETQTALQIVLSTGKFQPGTYRCDPYKENWDLVEEP